ncbi:MAG TPA: AAA family ATPase [Pyrinomonadaceae bacterium]|jgi:predicted kinase
MEAIIFVGIQGTGKSTFYKERFFDTHIRVNLDMVRTKHREKLILEACLEAKQKFVVDKMNVTCEERARYIEKAKIYGFKVAGYYFNSNLKKALERNGRRTGRARVPDKGLFDAFKRLQIPAYKEGFDELFYVWISDENQFVVKSWNEPQVH